MISPGARAVVGRLGWGLTDQVFSSLTNVMMNILIIRNSESRQFGAFALVFSVYVFALGVTRALAAEPLSIRHSQASTSSDWRRATNAALGMTAVVGCLIGLGCMALAPFLPDVLGQQIFFIGILMPPLVVQDSLRYALFAQGHPRKAFMLDVGWAVVLFSVFAFIMASDAGEGAQPYVVAWALSSVPATIYLLVKEDVYPRVGRARSWFAENRDLGLPYIGEFFATGGSIQLSIYSLGIFGGVSVVGVIRAVQVLLGPVRVLQMSVRMLVIPEAARALSRSGAHFNNVIRGAIGGLVLATAVYGALLMLLPDGLGHSLLGNLWLSGRGILFPLVVQSVAGAVMMGAIVGLRALAAARLSLRARLIAAPLPIIGGTIGVVVGGLTGAAWGLALAGIASALVNIYYLQKAIFRARSQQVALGGDANNSTRRAEHGL